MSLLTYINNSKRLLKHALSLTINKLYFIIIYNNFILNNWNIDTLIFISK